MGQQPQESHRLVQTITLVLNQADKQHALEEQQRTSTGQQ